MTGTTTWRDERRKDRAAQAQIDRDDEAARSKLRAAERKAAQDRNLAARKARAARRASAARWCAEHAADLMLAPVIAASLVLSWTGMASYGTRDYGVTGLVLPVISEGGAWAFAFSAAFCARRSDPRLWACRIGVVVFAGAGAALNFLHGEALILHGEARGGVTVGVTMAIVSMAGITAHQLIKAGPQRSRAERDEARIQRRAARRIRQAREAAVDAATVDLHADGGPAVVMTAAAVKPETDPVALPEPAAPHAPKVVPSEAPRAVTVAVNKGRHGTLMLSFVPPVRMPSEIPSPTTAKAQAKTPAVTGEVKTETPPATRRPTSPRRHGNRPDKVARLIAKGGMTNAEIARQAGVSLSTVERRQREAREKEESALKVVNLDDRRQA